MNRPNSIASFLSAESLQSFSGGMIGLSQEEIRKAKELFVRNAISEYQAEVKSHKNNLFTMGLHLLVPIFWPMLFGRQRESKIELEEKRNKILNALEVWKSDLPHCYNELRSLLAEPSNKR